jgi:twitching motility two-component system response regulator PilG
MMRKIHWYKEFEPPSLVVGILPEATAASWMSDLSPRHVVQSVEPFMNTLVMVIDDSATVRVIIETCLRQAGFAVSSFNDGIDAMRWLSQPDAALPALVFLDISLPHMDGYDVARQLKALPQLNATIIVMLSRWDGMVDRLKCRLAGASTFLAKPFTTYAILHVVETHLGHSTDTVRREKG